MTPRSYRMFGLSVSSDVVLEGISESTATAGFDLVIRRTELDHPNLDRALSDQFITDGTSQYFYWKAVGLFRIAAPDCIEVEPVSGVTDRLVALPLLGTVVAGLLVRRGHSVLHASAVSMGGEAIIMLGHKGAGKSTTATTLVASGCDLISDDVVALRASPSGLVVLPAYGLVKLWHDSARQLDPNSAHKLWQLHDAVDKAHFQFGTALASTPLPVARLYVLGRGAAPGVEVLPAGQALPAALEHTYMSRYGVDGFAGSLPQHFAVLGELAGAGAIRRLTVPNDLKRTAEILDLVRADLAVPTGIQPFAGSAGSAEQIAHLRS